MSRPSLFTSFKRAQIASLIATVVDFVTLVMLVEHVRVYYVTATAIGAFVGAVTNFLLGRLWSFRAVHGKYTSQAFRYALVSAGSLVLNSLGVWWFTEHHAIPYTLSKIATALLVGIFFNFPLHRAFVFR